MSREKKFILSTRVFYAVTTGETLGTVSMGPLRDFSLSFWTESNHVALAILKLTMQIRLASNSRRSVCLCLPSANVKSVHCRDKQASSLEPWILLPFPVSSHYLKMQLRGTKQVHVAESHDSKIM